MSKLAHILKTLCSGTQIGFVVSKTFPSGDQNFAFEFPLRKFLPVLYTSDEELLVCLGFEKLKPHLYVHSNKTGVLLHKILLKYAAFKVCKVVHVTEHFIYKISQG